MQPFSEDAPETKYCALLTSCASNFVIKQFHLIDKVKKIHEGDGEFTVETSNGFKIVSVNGCECIFRQSMKLPCRHMLALRKKLKEPLFDAECCDKRWTSQYYRETQ